MAQNEQSRTRAKAWDIDAARRRAGTLLLAGLADYAGWLGPPAAALGRCRSRTWTPGALAAGRLRLRHRGVIHRRSRTGLVGSVYTRTRWRHRRIFGAPGCAGFCHCARPDCYRRRLCHRDTADATHRASGFAIPGRERDALRIRRNPRGARVQRPHRGARTHNRRPPPERGARPCAACGAQNGGASGRQFRRAQGASVAATRAVAARRLRLRA